MPDETEALALRPPAPEWIEPLKALYRLWDEPNATGIWARDLERRMAAAPGRGRALDAFYVAPHRSARGEQAASALDVSRSASRPGLAIVHRVFTHPAVRRKGLASGLMDEAKRAFRGSGGRLLIVVAPSTGVAAEFYRSQGFHEAVRASDGETLFGWAARGRHVREALLRFLKHEPERWRPATPGDWAALVAYAALPGGRPDTTPDTLLDPEWAEVFERLPGSGGAGGVAGAGGGEGGSGGEEPISLEVAESRHGYVVGLRASAPSGGGLPEWLRRLAAAG